MSRKLHIGGQVKSDGWEILDILPGPYVDHLGNACDLSRFEDNTFSDIYASHVLEHFDYTKEIEEVLVEWHRVLIPRGSLFISTPDLDTLAKLFISKDILSLEERFFVMRMIFGGHLDRYDYHNSGLNQDFLAHYLLQAGFINLRRVDSFGLFKDTSNMVYKGVPISINIIAEKP